MDLGNTLIEIAKKKRDSDYEEKWKRWKPNQEPFLAIDIYEELKSNEILKNYGIKMQAVQIEFLGVWDTVPGSALMKYKPCKEEEEPFYKFWKGDRYKTDSYPTIKNIAQAVSIDEKRSKFEPLLLCPAINPDYTKVNEKWFAGAHSDVGGGYDDSNVLADISLKWMLSLLKESYEDAKKINVEEPDISKSIIHWSFYDFPGNIGSECKDREIPNGANIDESVKKLRGPIRVIKEGKIMNTTYPDPCKCPEG